MGENLSGLPMDRYFGVPYFAGPPNNSFQLADFFHLDGASNAVAVDFDQEGEIDIAEIAYLYCSLKNQEKPQQGGRLRLI